MNEIISLHIGSAGCGLGLAFWERLCIDSGIGPDGMRPGGKGDLASPFFSYAAQGKHQPRAVFVDTKPSVINEIRTGAYRQLFLPAQLLTGKEGSSGNFARGRYTIGNQIADLALDRLRRQVDQCKSLQGFIVTMAVGGGTGSGLGALLLERMKIDYGSQATLVFAIYPSEWSARSICEPYNVVLATSHLLEHANIVIPLDNAAAEDLFREQHGEDTVAGFRQMNQMMAGEMLTATASLRSGEPTDLVGLQANLVPGPRRPFVPCAALLSRFTRPFDQMYEKRAYVSWYTAEGMDESELSEARDNVRSLEKD